MKELIHFLDNIFGKKVENKKSTIYARDIVILPRDEQTHLASEKREIIYEVLEKYKILQKFAGYNDYYIKVSDQTVQGMSILKTYNVWTEPLFSEIKTPKGLPRKDSDFICPHNLFLVTVECANKHTTSYRSGEWGIDGYVLLMLVDPQNKEILDARGEVAR